MNGWIGAALPRKEDRRMLLGRGRFVGDLNRPGLLHAAFVRSPHAHALVTRIDGTAAGQAPGVERLFTAESLGHPYLLALLEQPEFVPTAMPILAGDKVRFVGEPVAVVIADDAYRAEDAAELVEVDWDPQPAVASMETATAAGAPQLHDHGGLEARATFDPPGTFSSACHAAMVMIDPGTGAIRLHRYLVVEDCGVVINPIVVDGQVRGGVTQGAAAALLERVRFDPEGQPVSATLMDYLAPTAAEMCAVDIVHLQTPSKFSETGAKGMGEGGTIGAPAAVLGAVNDALSDTDVRFDHIPVLPHEVSAALSQAGAIA